MYGQISGNDCVIGGSIYFSPHLYHSSTFWLNDNKFITTFGEVGEAVVGDQSYLSNSLGIATTNGSDGDLVQVTFSGIVDGLSGLNDYSDYYADDNGNLTTTVTDRYLGYALSDTQLKIETTSLGSDTKIHAKDIAGVSTNGSNGQVLSSNGDGSFSWGNIEVTNNEIDGSSNSGQVLISDSSGDTSWQFIQNEKNEFTVASGQTISVGDIVAFSDGKISKGVSGLAEPYDGSAYSFNSAIKDYVCGAKISETSFVIAFRDRTTTTGRAIIGQIDDLSVSWGAEYTFSSTDIDTLAIESFGDNSFVLLYGDVDNGYKGTSIVGSVNGSEITFADKIIANDARTLEIELCQLNNNTIVALYRDEGNTSHQVNRIGEISGDTITWGANDYLVSDGNYAEDNALVCLNESQFVAIYDDSDIGKAVVGNVSGTAISYGEEYTFNAADIIHSDADRINDNTFLIAYKINYSPYDGIAIIGQVSGDTISFGTPNTFNSETTSAISTAGLPDGRFILTYKNLFNQSKCFYGKVSGKEFGSTDYIYYSASNPYVSDTFWLNENKFVTTYGTIGGAVVSKQAYVPSIGIATTSGNSGDKVQVTFSGIADGLSGLSEFTDYYADESGNLTTTKTDRYLGYALTSSQLKLQTTAIGSDVKIHATDISGISSNGGNGQILSSNGDGTFSWTEIAANSEISDGSITTEKISDNAITYTKIAAGSIAADRLAGSNSSPLNNGTSGQSLSSNGDGTFSWIQSTPFSSLSTAGGAVYSYSIGLDDANTGSGPGEFDYPYFLTMDDAGILYVSDTYNNRIQLFTTEGQYIKSIGSSGTGAGEFDESNGIAVHDSKIYVVDQKNHRVQVLNADSGVFDYSIGTGTSGSNPGEFDSPSGIAVDNNGKIYVADSRNHRVQVFSASGSFEYSIGTGIAGSNAGEFNRPYDVYVDSAGKIYVTDQSNSRVQIFSASGEYVNSFGSSGQGPGEFGSPTGITIDSVGKIYVSDYDHRIQVFSSSYAYEYSIGTLDSSLDAGKFEEPVGMFVNETGKLFVADSYNQRIQIFQVPVTGYFIEIGSIGLGTSSPTETLEVVGSIKFVDGNQSDGKLFISNDDGKGSWQTIDAIPNNSIQITKIAGSSNTNQVLVTDSSGNSSWQYIKNEMNEFTVASGASISVGDMVQFDDNVISKGIGSYSTIPTVGTKSTFNTGTTDHTCGVKINDTTFVSVFRDRTTETGRAIIGQLNGTTISWGDQYTFSVTDVDNVAVCLAGENTFVVMYEDKALTREGMAIVGTVNGTDITFGSKILSNVGNTYSIELTQLDNNKIVAQYRDDGNAGYETVLVGEVNGYSITWGANDYPVSDAKYVAANSLNTLNPSKIISIYNYGNAGKASIGEISGTAVSFGDEYTFQAGSIIYPSIA
ncbi:MAG: hypothetical protein OMM_08835, partial [Candidatus Magnetoglobus multicellularis str. Araruama]